MQMHDTSQVQILKDLSVTHLVTISVDFRGLTERLVSVASIGVKVLHFDIDPRVSLFLGNITDLGHPEVCRTTAAEEALIAAWQ